MTGNQLKILALFTMTVDHVGLVLLPQYLILRIIGRLTYPIFAYMIAEGCFYTHSKARYLGGIVALGAACQVGFFVATASLEQSILSTFALSIITIFALQRLGERRDLLSALALAGALALDAIVTMVLPSVLGFGFSIDYGFFGVLLPVFVYLPRIFFKKTVDKRHLRLMLVGAAVGTVLLCLQMSDWLYGIEWFALFALVPLSCYNGKRGTRRLKYLFYVYYPLHLVVIWSMALLLS